MHEVSSGVDRRNERASVCLGEISEVSLFKPKVASDQVRRLKDLVREVWALPEGVIISVMEVECMEASCPGLETNIMLMSDRSDPRLFKVDKPLAKVTSKDLTGLKEVL